ncbi:MAG: sulfatase [Phycisphaeraceae bacterium]|nr:sulfatase [Phycisphaeraceae bacterium]
MRPIATAFLFVLAVLIVIGIGVWLMLPNHPGSSHSASTTSRSRQPNVVLISLDTVRPDHLSLYGYARKTTPNIERFFAQDGAAVFSQARAQAPWTLPSHMSLFTSMLPSQNGVDSINQVLPDSLTTLPQILQTHGYRTAALVNNGQMRAHWGFNRGFDEWREFAVDTPQGECGNITSEAIQWMSRHQSGDASTDKGNAPFFLFLHYYDAHDPYDAPETFKKAMGATLSGAQSRELAESHRFPGNDLDAKAKESLIASYDAQLAWLDDELGKLFDKLPPNTLVVLFSDHGEAFDEHGWTLHGASLYEEEIRVALAMRFPGLKTSTRRFDEQVTLLDVAPTILTACGFTLPSQFTGNDLRLLLDDVPLPPRLVQMETKAVLEGKIVYGAVLNEWKATYSLLDGVTQVFKLPDESKTITGSQGSGQTLVNFLHDVAREDEYWMITAAGDGDFEVSLEATAGKFALFIPIDFDAERDRIEPSEDGTRIKLVVYPRGKQRRIYLKLSDPTAGIRLDFKHNGIPSPAEVRLGESGSLPTALPTEVTLETDLSDPVMTGNETVRPGLSLRRHKSLGKTAPPRNTATPDEETLRQLRSLGYTR